MRHSEAAKEFGRHFLRVIERKSNGEWVRAREAFTATMKELEDNAYVVYIKEVTARQIKVTYVVEERREKEFPHIERRKDGTHQSAPVYYRAPSV